MQLQSGQIALHTGYRRVPVLCRIITAHEPDHYYFVEMLTPAEYWNIGYRRWIKKELLLPIDSEEAVLYTLAN